MVSSLCNASHKDMDIFLFYTCSMKSKSSIYYHLPGNIFYLMEYREIFLTLLRKFDETKQPHSYLKDLVESTHLFLRMLERFCKGRRNLMVQVSSFIKLVILV